MPKKGLQLLYVVVLKERNDETLRFQFDKRK